MPDGLITGAAGLAIPLAIFAVAALAGWCVVKLGRSDR